MDLNQEFCNFLCLLLLSLQEILNHVVIKLLTRRKWEKYASFWFRLDQVTVLYTLFMKSYGYILKYVFFG